MAQTVFLLFTDLTFYKPCNSFTYTSIFHFHSHSICPPIHPSPSPPCHPLHVHSSPSCILYYFFTPNQSNLSFHEVPPCPFWLTPPPSLFPCSFSLLFWLTPPPSLFPWSFSLPVPQMSPPLFCILSSSSLSLSLKFVPLFPNSPLPPILPFNHIPECPFLFPLPAVSLSFSLPPPSPLPSNTRHSTTTAGRAVGEFLTQGLQPMWVEVVAECCTSSCTAQPGPESQPELPWPKLPGTSALAVPGPRPPGTGAWEQTGGEEEQQQDQSIRGSFYVCSQQGAITIRHNNNNKKQLADGNKLVVKKKNRTQAWKWHPPGTGAWEQTGGEEGTGLGYENCTKVLVESWAQMVRLWGPMPH